jgi:hypothetical protein
VLDERCVGWDGYNEGLMQGGDGMGKDGWDRTRGRGGDRK